MNISQDETAGLDRWSPLTAREAKRRLDCGYYSLWGFESSGCVGSRCFTNRMWSFLFSNNPNKNRWITEIMWEVVITELTICPIYGCSLQHIHCSRIAELLIWVLLWVCTCQLISIAATCYFAFHRIHMVHGSAGEGINWLSACHKLMLSEWHLLTH